MIKFALKSIISKYHGPTAKKVAQISVQASDGNKKKFYSWSECENLITSKKLLKAKDEIHFQELVHFQAVKQYIAHLGFETKGLVIGSLRIGEFVFLFKETLQVNLR